MKTRLKAERVQHRSLPITPEDLQNQKHEITGWQVDPTPNAIFRRFPKPSFSASAAFVNNAVVAVENSGRAPYIVVDAHGISVWLGNPPSAGVTQADIELAAALNAAA